MVIRGRAVEFFRHHASEFVLLLALATPVLVVRWSMLNVLVVVGFFVLYTALSFWGDVATQLRVDDVGIEYLAGGRHRSFLAWSEIARAVPRRFRGWNAEDALVFQDRAGAPLLVAAVSMFDRTDLERIGEVAGRHITVEAPVILSPFTGRADGVRRPDLVPQRTSERLLASSIGGLVTFVVVFFAIWVLTR